MRLWEAPPLHLQQQPNLAILEHSFLTAPLWNIYTSGLKVTMPIKIQILSHIHQNTPFLLPLQREWHLMLQFWLQFSRILFSAGSVWAEKLWSLSYDYKVWYFTLKVNVENSCHFRPKPCPVKIAFFPWYISLFLGWLSQFQRNKVRLIGIEIKFFTWVCCDLTDRSYGYSITCFADHLGLVNSSSLHNFHSINPCHSQSRLHEYDFKILLQLRIPCTHSITKPPCLTPSA